MSEEKSFTSGAFVAAGFSLRTGATIKIAGRVGPGLQPWAQTAGLKTCGTHTYVIGASLPDSGPAPDMTATLNVGASSNATQNNASDAKTGRCNYFVIPLLNLI